MIPIILLYVIWLPLTMTGKIIAADIPINQKFMSEHRLSISQHQHNQTKQSTICQQNNIKINIVIDQNSMDKHHEDIINNRQSKRIPSDRLTNTTADESYVYEN